MLSRRLGPGQCWEYMARCGSICLTTPSRLVLLYRGDFCAACCRTLVLIPKVEVL